MPRPPRYSLPGAIHHVMLRGNQGRPIFYSDKDRVYCCLLLQEILERHGHRIHAFCFMSNHVHFAWQQGNEGLSFPIQNFAFRYAQRINRCRGEVGHIFQGRFKSILINKENYLTQLVRYIHLNPVRAGIVARPEDYKWCSHNMYLGNDPVTWLERDWVLKTFAGDRDIAIKRYAEFIHGGIGCEPEIDFKLGLRSGIIGDDVFIQEVFLKENRLDSPGDLKVSVWDLIKYVCTRYGVTEEEIMSESRLRTVCHVRAVIALLGRNLKGLSIAEIAKSLKKDSGGLSRLALKLEKKSKSLPSLKQEIQSMQDEILDKNKALSHA